MSKAQGTAGSSLSIVIPAYNEERYLKACLESIKKQTVMPDEVLVVDNNSTDKTAKIAGSFSFVTIIKEPRQGIIFARDKGFNAVASDIIARIDADSVMPIDWVERIKLFYSQESNHQAALAGSPDFTEEQFSNLINFAYSLLVFDINRLLIGYPTLWGSNMAITSTQWRAVRAKTCRRTDIHEDLDLTMHLHESGYRIVLDRRLKVRAHLRRLDSGWRELWDYLNWWPRNLRVHNKITWPVCWLICLGLFMGSMVMKTLSRKA